MNIFDVELANSRQGGRYDLHCKVETLSDEFVNSSIVELEPRRSSDDSSVTPSEWPTFTYNFRTSSAEAAIFFKLSSFDTSAGGEELVEIARGFVPYQFHDSSQAKQVAIMNSLIEGIPLGKFEGKILFEIAYSCNKSQSAASNSSQNEITIQWPGMNISQSNLPLISAQPLLTTPKNEESDAGSLHSAVTDQLVREEETHEEEEEVDKGPSRASIQDLTLREERSLTRRGMMFPSSNASVIIFFHAVNLPTQLLNRLQLGLQPVSCFADERETSNRSGPFCKWVGSGFGSTQGPSYSYLSVLKSVRLNLDDSQPPSIGLYLFSRAIQEPLLSAYEDTDSLAPFSFYHRVWPYGVETPVTTIDQFLMESSYALTSACLVPPRSEYNSYQGLELIVTSVALDSVNDSEIVLGGKITDDKMKIPQSAEGPPFISSRASQENNYKIALLHNSDAATTKCYLFFGSDSSTNLQSLSFCLDLHLFSVDSINNVPWWKNLHSSVQLPLNEEVIHPLLGEDGKSGVIWQVRKDTFDANIILRWKTKKMEFLSDMEQTAIDQLPCLKFELTQRTVSVSSGSTFLQTLLSVNDDEVKSQETVDDEVPQQEQQPLVPAESVHLLSQYKATLEEMRSEITRLREDKNRSEQENRQLLQHLDEAQHNSTATNSRLRVQLEAMSKGDLVNMVEHLQSRLDQETAQKIYFQQKVHSLQNALIQKNDMENELLVIQKAHTGQQILVHELQRKVKKYRKCYDAWLKQEATIARMEEALLALAHEKEKSPPSQPKSAHQQTSQIQALEHDESDTKRETVRVLELRLVTALHRISHLEGALQATTSFSQRGAPQAATSLSQHYPNVPPFAASSGTELQLQQELIEAEAKMERLKQENRTLRTNISQEQSSGHPHQEEHELSTISDQA